VVSSRLSLALPRATRDARSQCPPRLSTLSATLEGRGRDELIFTAPRGGPLRYQNFLSRVWRRTLLRLGLPAVGVHVLRHSAAARIVAAGGSAKTFQTVLGHRSASFSLTVYGHLFDADLDALADRLDAMTAKHG
jgi:integrase